MKISGTLLVLGVCLKELIQTRPFVLILLFLSSKGIESYATSLAFHQHHSVKQVMDAASWTVVSALLLFILETSPLLILGWDQ